MESGRLRHRLQFQTNTPTTNADNQEIDSWSTTFTVWGEVKESRTATPGRIPGEEGFTGDRFAAERAATFTIRYRDDVTETMRIAYNSKNWRIYGIYDPDGRRTMLTITASTIA